MKNMFDLLRAKHPQRFPQYGKKKRKAQKSELPKVKITIICHETNTKKTEVHAARKRQLRGYAKGMHRRPTKHEAIMYELLQRRFDHLYIKRQAVVMIDAQTAYILDIYLPARKLAIEVDGPSHEDRKQYDLIRDERVKNHFGIKTIRFTNNQVEHFPDEVCQAIRREIDREHKPKIQPVRNPLPVLKGSSEYRERPCRVIETDPFLNEYLKRKASTRSVQT